MFVDDRNELQKKTHTFIIGGKCSFLSGWGKGMPASYAYWACKPEHRCMVEKWVNSRSDIKRSYIISDIKNIKYKKGHVHLYVVTDEHPAVEERKLAKKFNEGIKKFNERVKNLKVKG